RRRQVFSEVLRLQGRVVDRRVRQGRAGQDVGRSSTDWGLQGARGLESRNRSAISAEGIAASALAADRRPPLSTGRQMLSVAPAPWRAIAGRSNSVKRSEERRVG